MDWRPWKNFLSWGYNEQQLKLEIQWALDISREASLLPQCKQDKCVRTPLVVMYHPLYHLFIRPPSAISLSFMCLRMTVGKLSTTTTDRLPPYKELEWSPGLSNSNFHPTWVAWQPSVQSFLVQNLSYKDGNGQFSNHNTGESFKLKMKASCKSSNIIYFITCRRCGQQYVGETGQPLHHRINSHRFDTAHGRTDESPAAEYFSGDSHSIAIILVMVIDQIQSCNPCLQKIMTKQIDKNPWDFLSFWNGPQGRFLCEACLSTIRETPWIYKSLYYIMVA